MAGEGSSPGGRAGPGGLQPLRATVPFQLQQRRGDGARAGSVPCALEKPGSRDTIPGSCRWPREGAGAASRRDRRDKATQTPVSWPEGEAGPGSPGSQSIGSQSMGSQSTSGGSSDHRREIAKLKQQLQRTKLSGRSGKEKEKIPFPGDHAVLGSLQDSPSGFLSPSPVLRLSPCLHRSLEGLNQELEEAFVKEQGEEELLRILDVPDGHRAPAPAQQDSLDASLALEAGSGSWSSLSPSPSVQRPGAPEPSEAQLEPKEKARSSPSPLPAFPASPRPNHSCVFQREPPEGCERVQAFEEALIPRPFQPSCPDKNKVHFTPSGSAFCPVRLVPPLFPNVGFLFRSFPAPPSPSCRPPSPFLGEVSKAPGRNCDPWKRGQPEESVVFHSSLVA